MTGLSGAHDNVVTPGKTVIGVTAVIAKELGLKAHRVRDLISFLVGRAIQSFHPNLDWQVKIWMELLHALPEPLVPAASSKS